MIPEHQAKTMLMAAERKLKELPEDVRFIPMDKLGQYIYWKVRRDTIVEVMGGRA